MNRYRPDRAPRRLAMLAALTLTASLLAGIHAAAEPEHGAIALPATFTGEVTADGPVYRLPDLHVTARHGFELALPAFIDRALGAAPQRDRTAQPSA